MNCFLRSSPVDLKSPVAVVARDAGAANLIVSWLLDFPGIDIRLCVEGAAQEIFASEFPQLDNWRLAKALKGAAVLLSGTSSLATDIEHRARLQAREMGIPSIGVIDHWVNYNQRFIRKDHQVLPDEIWVSDHDAFSLAQTCFPGHPVRQLPNRYLERTVDLINAKSSGRFGRDSFRVLYVLEPILERWGESDVPGEFQALDFFVEKMALLGLGSQTEIRLRLHPSETPGKYDGWCRAHSGLNLSVDTRASLPEMIAWADWVVGCHTVAMVVAFHANRYTLSTLPPLAPGCALPQKEIKMLRDLIPAIKK